MAKCITLTALIVSLVFLGTILFTTPQAAPPQRGVSYFDYCTKLIYEPFYENYFFDKCLFGDHQQEI